MDCSKTLVLLGLLLDIAGIVLLFYTGSRRRRHAEISYELLVGFAPKPDDEAGDMWSYEEHHERTSALKERLGASVLLKESGSG